MSPRVLIACEYSGVVRNAFLDRGYDAWSCDLLPSEDGSNRHITGDALDILNDGWDIRLRWSSFSEPSLIGTAITNTVKSQRTSVIAVEQP